VISAHICPVRNSLLHRGDVLDNVTAPAHIFDRAVNELAPYAHIVFTLPREVASLALQNKQVIYNLLFHASAETLLEIARDPRHLGAEIGFFSVLGSSHRKKHPG